MLGGLKKLSCGRRHAHCRGHSGRPRHVQVEEHDTHSSNVKSPSLSGCNVGDRPFIVRMYTYIAEYRITSQCHPSTSRFPPCVQHHNFGRPSPARAQLIPPSHRTGCAACQPERDSRRRVEHVPLAHWRRYDCRAHGRHASRADDCRRA